MLPRISIIVPCYNGEKYLRETLDCLLAQTIEDWECIIVDDGSSDGSLEIMKEYAARDARYKYIEQANRGPAVARNTAIAASCGKYILPLDADDVIAPSYAEKAIDYLETHPNTKLVYCEAEFFGSKKGLWDLPEYDYDGLLLNNCIFCSAVYRRSDYNETKGYNPNMKTKVEDWDFWLSLLSKEDDVYRIPEVLFFYRQHDSSRTTLDNGERGKLQIRLNHPDIYGKGIETLKWRLRIEIESIKIEIKKIIKRHRALSAIWYC